MNILKEQNTRRGIVNSVVRLALVVASALQASFVIAANPDTPAVNLNENWENVSAAFAKQLGADNLCAGLIVTPNGDIVIQTVKKGICVSRDQGATWSAVADNDIRGWCDQGWGFSIPYPYDGRMVFFGVDGGRTAGGISLDDAKTWKPLVQTSRGVQSGDVDWSVHDPRAIFGLTHEPYFSVLSDDGGKTWRRIDSNEIGNGAEAHYSMGMLDGKTLLRGNPNEDIIELSNDAGGTWSQVTNYKTLGHRAVHYGKNVYWATANGVIVTSNGKDWNLSGLGAEGACYGPFFGSSEREFVVVTDKSFLKTEDGGKTWKSIAQFYKAPDIFRPNSTMCCYFGWDPKHNILYASGLNASVYRLKL